MTPTTPLLDAMLDRRLTDDGHAWVRATRASIESGLSGERLAALLSTASRHAPRGALAPSRDEVREADRLLPGWSPERWTALEALRVRLLVAHPRVADAEFAEVLEECFRYADAGELAALYRSLAHLPAGERFVWRAGEGCRSNMRPVFEAVACDTPYPARHFDDVAWRQLVLKAVFVEAPLWRVHGLDERLSPELARMALDFADERKSAGRPVPPELWLCVGAHGGERALAALDLDSRSSDPRVRRAAALGLGRAGAEERLREALEREADPEVRSSIEDALAGRCDRSAFAIFEGGRD